MNFLVNNPFPEFGIVDFLIKSCFSSSAIQYTIKILCLLIKKCVKIEEIPTAEKRVFQNDKAKVTG